MAFQVTLLTRRNLVARLAGPLAFAALLLLGGAALAVPPRPPPALAAIARRF